MAEGMAGMHLADALVLWGLWLTGAYIVFILLLRLVFVYFPLVFEFIC